MAKCGTCDPAQVEMLQKQMHCLCQQIQGLEGQIDTLQNELDHARVKNSQCCRELEDMRRKLCQRDDALSRQESKMEELRYELKDKERQHQRMAECFNEKLCATQEVSNQREACLNGCKTELSQLAGQLDEIKATTDCEINQRDTCLRQMKDDMRRLYDELKDKTCQNAELDQALVEAKGRYHQTVSSLKECDTRVTCLNDKISQLECQAQRDRQDLSRQIEEAEARSRQAAGEAQCLVSELKTLRRIMQEKEEELEACCGDKAALCRELASEKEEVVSLRERASSFENDNKEICRLLQQKAKRIKELEQVVCCKEQELEQCTCCVDELNARIRKMNTQHSRDGEKDIHEQLTECRNKLKKTECDLAEVTKKLEWAVAEMECLVREVKRLSCELDDAKKEICEKNSLIEDLQQVIRHAEHDLEARMRRADEQLQLYEQDIQDKARLLSECEEKAMRLQNALCDKELERDQCEQKLCRVTSDNTTLCSKLREAEECKDVLQRANKDMQCQLTEVCQELTVLKDQFQHKTSELVDAQRELDGCQREVERQCRETEAGRQRLQEKQSELAMMCDEKNALSAKLASLQCRYDTETCQLQQAAAEARARLEGEVEQLRACQCQMEDSNSALMAKVSSGQRQSAALEKTYCTKLDQMARESSLLRAKLGDRDDQLQAVKDCLTVKDSEIMRLKLRLCSLDRCAAPCATDVCNSNVNALPQTALEYTTDVHYNHKPIRNSYSAHKQDDGNSNNNNASHVNYRAPGEVNNVEQVANIIISLILHRVSSLCSF